MNVKVIYEDNHIIVCNKKEGILSQEDATKDPDMVTILKNYLKEKYNKTGNVFVGLVHRLDRRVGGVMVFAKTSKAASRLSLSIREGQFEKGYLAIVSGFVDGSGVLRNQLEKIGKVSCEDDEGKECLLEYTYQKHFKIDEQVFTVLKINLLTGRFNQIRKQLSIINHPIINDFKYGYRGKNHDDVLGLCAYKISFPHPITGKRLIFYKEQEYHDGWMKYLEGMEN